LRASATAELVLLARIAQSEPVLLIAMDMVDARTSLVFAVLDGLDLTAH